MMHKATSISDDVKAWMAAEADPLISTSDSTQQVIIEYPDLISGVLDCVANVALLTIDKIRRSLYHVMLRASSMTGPKTQHQLKANYFLDNQETLTTLEQWHQRAMTAFSFVQAQSELAAKPLDFGLRQVQSSGFGGPIDIINESTP